MKNMFKRNPKRGSGSIERPLEGMLVIGLLAGGIKLGYWAATKVTNMVDHASAYVVRKPEPATKSKKKAEAD